ncbi:MAG: heavy-metal-associated domain-containing protein [Actinobacteria bacterium]|nr:heavy-metal-associated domain-containing protein [Actinomycetota bacterium]
MSTSTLNYTVTGMTCQHCVNAVSSEVGAVPGVTEVAVDLTAGEVTVVGTDLDDAAIRAAIDEAGYEVA